jgi:hypothetical protein
MWRIAWLFVLLVMIACLIGCWSGRRRSGGGTNLGRGSDYDGPWNGGGSPPALTGP